MSCHLLGRAPGFAPNAPTLREVDRVFEIWTDALERSGGPFLFGAFSIADAFFAPVCSRFVTYAVPVPSRIAAYIERIHALPAMQSWIKDAKAEHDFIAVDEPYRTAPQR